VEFSHRISSTTVQEKTSELSFTELLHQYRAASSSSIVIFAMRRNTSARLEAGSLGVKLVNLLI